MKTMIPFIILSALMSCAPAPEIKTREPLFSASENQVVISEKADQDVIVRKYKNSIKLKCDFFIDNRADFNLAFANSFAGFTVNLAAGESPANLIATMNNGQVFTTGVRVKEFDIRPLEIFEDESGARHILRNTPVVKLIARGRDVHGDRDKRYQKVFTVGEKRSVVITDLYPKKYPHILKCELVTNIVDGYETDYEVIQPVKENEELPVEETSPEVTPANPSPAEETPVEVTVSEQKPEESTSALLVIPE